VGNDSEPQGLDMPVDDRLKLRRQSAHFVRVLSDYHSLAEKFNALDVVFHEAFPEVSAKRKLYDVEQK
jgi:hypothetical protein